MLNLIAGFATGRDYQFVGSLVLPHAWLIMHGFLLVGSIVLWAGSLFSRFLVETCIARSTFTIVALHRKVLLEFYFLD